MDERVTKYRKLFWL